MKKLLISFSLVMFIFTLSACSSPYPQRKSLNYLGTIRQNGGYYSLETDEGSFRIKSTFLNLQIYQDKKVKIHGQFSKDLFFVDDVKPATN